MREAIFGFIGVIVGGLLTAMKDLVIETRRERRQAEQTGRLEATSIRLVLTELDHLGEHFRNLANLGRTPSWTRKQAPDHLATSEWEAHKAILAAAIEDGETWERLTRLYFLARSTRTWLARAEPRRPLKEEEIDNFREAKTLAVEVGADLRRALAQRQGDT